MNARVKSDRSPIRQRRCAAEHPFGTIKRMTAGSRFLTRGLKKVAGEAALSVPAYNIIRARQPRRRRNSTRKARLTKRPPLTQQKKRPRKPGASDFSHSLPPGGLFILSRYFQFAAQARTQVILS